MFLRALLLFAAACSAISAHACSIPVFRYALDRWPADPYALDISTNDAKDAAVAKFLRNLTDSTPLNLMTVRLRTDGASSLKFPHPEPGTEPAWSGALDGMTLPRITDSPVRAEIVRRILAGECAVWVLVESGQRAADDQAAAVLEKRLHYLEQVAQIPPIDPGDPSSQLGPGPALRVKFSLMRIRHDDEAERTFVAMLAGPKGDVANVTGPWFAMVFGRGRVLGAWPAEGFGNEQIDEACTFILAACSCQVKRMNPGWDLLLDVNWDESLQAIGFPSPGDAPAAPIPGGAPAASAEPAAPHPEAARPALPKPAAPKPETVIIAPSAAVVTPQRNPVIPAVIAASVLLVLGGGLAFRSIRRQP